MEWSEDAIILGARRHGEGDTILEVMTHERGRHAGLVRGGRSKRLRPVLQAGNSVTVTWRARLEEHLGMFTVEPVALRAAQLMHDRSALLMANLLCSYALLLPERDPHPQLFDGLVRYLEALPEDRTMAETLLRFELLLLEELGFGLDLTCCAATGATQDLTYVSPKTGRAVSRRAGTPYRAKLLVLPPFVLDDAPDGDPSAEDWQAAFHLTGFFLQRHVFEPRGIPVSESRASLIKALKTANFIEETDPVRL